MSWVNKETIAEHLDTSVRSVERFQQLGMPHKKKGKKPFKVGWCIHWYIGYSESKPYGLKDKNGLTLTLFGYAIGGHNILELRDKARELSEVMGYVDLEIGQALGILKQSNLIPTKH